MTKQSRLEVSMRMYEARNKPIDFTKLITFEDVLNKTSAYKKFLKKYPTFAIPTAKEIKQVVELSRKEATSFYLNPEGILPYFYYGNYMLYEIPILDKKYLDNVLDLDVRIESFDEHLEEALDDRDFTYFLTTLVDKRVHWLAYSGLFDKIPDNEKYDIFIANYIRSEYGFGDNVELFEKAIKYQDRESVKRILRDLGEYSDDNILTIYRGVASGSTPLEKSYSWTLDKGEAEYFATRFLTSGVIYTAEIPITKVIDYITKRDEQEILARYSDLQNVRILEKVKRPNKG